MKKNIVEQTQVKDNSRTSIVYIAVIVALALTLSLLAAAFLLTYADRNKSEARLQDYYFQAMSELGESVDAVELGLSKLTVSLSRRAAGQTLDELTTHSGQAVCALSRLPIECEQTYSAVKLLNQIADFASSYQSALYRGGDTDGFVKSAASFRRAADRLQEKVRAMAARAESAGKIDCGMLDLKGLPQPSGDDVQDLQPDEPEMIYDGPFSDSRLPVCFKGLENLKEITESQAVEKFERLLSVHGAGVIGKSSNPAAYEIEAPSGAYAALSVNGGMVLELSVPDNSSGTVNLTEEDAYSHAAEYSAKLGYGDLVPVWYLAQGAQAYINMAPQKDGAILYTDLVKVKISLSDGSLLGLEATGFCRNHIDREIRPVISESRAAALSGIDYDSVRLCVIPDGETEAVCYEVHGYADGMEFFVYLDAVNGEKIKALKVIESGGGRLTA